MSIERVLSYFQEVSAIPRRSGDEEAIAAYLMHKGESLGLPVFRDAGGNVIIRKLGNTGDPPTILQAHMDMVWESTGRPYEAGVSILKRDGKLCADHSTLGADNGIGIALILTLLERDDISNVEALFTSDEEIGMSGAMAADSSLLSGCRLINLDSEKEGVFTTSAAGGLSLELTLPTARRPHPNSHYPAWQLQVSGAKGGHSGLDIGRRHGNAIQILFQWLNKLGAGWDLLSLKGGSRSSAIPVQAEAVIHQKERQTLLRSADEIMRLWHAVEPELQLTVHPAEIDCPCAYTSESKKQLLALAPMLPHGVQAESGGMILLSSNLARIWEENGQPHIEIGLRASTSERLQECRSRLVQLLQPFLVQAAPLGEYPPWERNEESRLEQLFLSTYQELFCCEAVCEYVHAGVECSILGQTLPMVKDMISIGPTILGAHTVAEEVEVQSIAKLEMLLEAILQKSNHRQP